MLPEAVIDRQVVRKPVVPHLRVLEGHGVSPFPAQGLDKLLVLSVDAGRIGPGADMGQAMRSAIVGERLRDVGGAVVVHEPEAFDPLAIAPS